MSSYSALDTTAYTATAISTTTIATIDIASNITRQRSDSELVAERGRAVDRGRNLNLWAAIRGVFRAIRNPLRARCGSVAALLLLRSCGASSRRTPLAHYPTSESRSPRLLRGSGCG